MVDSSILITTLIGMLGVVIGAIISNYFNQKIAAKSARRGLIFNKKIEYFESIIETLRNNLRLYRNSLKEYKKTRKAKKILKKMKADRKKFDVKNSQIYLDTRTISKKIRQFVLNEKTIFKSFENLSKNKEDKEILIKIIKENIKNLEKISNSLVDYMRNEIEKS
jgi:hypothetical protein